MTIIELNALPNGAHNNQTINGADPETFPVPNGWAIIPDGMETPNFPFGKINVDGNNPPVVTSWAPGEIPEPEPTPDPETPETEKSVWDELDAAYQEGYLEGVNAAYDQ